MSEGITHTAIVDDCARLALASSKVCEAFKKALTDHLDMARLGGITRHGDRHNVALLASFREQWPPADENDTVPRKLAFVLGWLSHRAADRTMKKVFRDLDGDCAESPRDCSVYNDACVLREVYGGGDPFSYVANEAGLKDHPGARGTNVAEAEDLFCAMWRRMLVRMHTFIPDDADAEAWLEKVAQTQQRLYVDLKRYAAAYASPDPDKWKRFITDANFYDKDDAIVRVARSLQNGESRSSADVDAAMDDPGNESRYAYMLKRAFGYCLAASAWFEKKITEDEVNQRLEIGRPELSG